MLVPNDFNAHNLCEELQRDVKRMIASVPDLLPAERAFFTDNLLVRIHDGYVDRPRAMEV